MKRFASLFAAAVTAGTLLGSSAVSHAQIGEMWLAQNPTSTPSKPVIDVFIDTTSNAAPVFSALSVSASLFYDPNVFAFDTSNPSAAAGPVNPYFNLVPGLGSLSSFVGNGTLYGDFTVQAGRSGTITGAVTARKFVTITFTPIAGVNPAGSSIFLSTAYFPANTSGTPAATVADVLSSVGYKGYPGFGTTSTLFHTEGDPLFAVKPAKITVTVPAPSSLIVAAMGIVPMTGLLRRRRINRGTSTRL